MSVNALRSFGNEMVTFAPAHLYHLGRNRRKSENLGEIDPLSGAAADLVFREARQGRINMLPTARPGELLALIAGDL
jgi:hypothetical protein